MDGDQHPGGDDEQALLEFLYVCPHGLAECDAQGRIGLINPACLQLLMQVAADPGMGAENLFELLAPFAPDLAARIAEDGRTRGLLLDAVRIHVGAPARPAARRPGVPARTEADPLVLALTVLRLAPDRLMVVLADVSQQVAQERQLREAEAWFNAVLHGDEAYAFFTLDTAGRIVEWNASGERLFGLAERDVLDQGGERVLGGGAAAAGLLAARLAAARREGWHVAEDWLPRGDGRFWGTSVIAVLRGHEPEPEFGTYLVVVRDTGNRRGSVEALRRGLSLDHLTGVLNRRTFHEQAERAIAAAARTSQPMAAIMVDADRFKAINDSHGHSAGDAVLVAIAGALDGGLRAGQDLVGRLGGEEFGILLPGLGLAEAAGLAERLRARIAALAIPMPGDAGATAAVRVTASFGIATLGAAAPDLAGLLRAADQALYVAKAAGRNRVATAGEDLRLTVAA